jgi:tetratricopeptide (TPR) repeat protein
MKNRLPGFLALLTVTLPTILAVNAKAAGVEIKILSNRAFVVSGGTGGQVWHIQYGAGMGPGRLPGVGVLSLAGPGSTAFFTHENWLRRIDTDRGIVTGRWHFPGMRIASLSWKDQHHLHVQVEDYQFAGKMLRSAIDFDPDDPQIPFWPTGSILSASTAELEAHCCRAAGFNNVSQANQWLDEAENTVRRDPLSPWLHIELGHIYRALGRPEAMNLFEQAVQIETADYSDLLRISPTLDDDGLPQLAREAFERGYARFWQRGMDPRRNASLLGQLLIYPNPRKISETLRAELIDRRYHIGPWVESAAYAWDSYAEFLESSGKNQEAAQWRQRSNEARENSLYMRNRTLMRWYEAAFALVPAVHLAAILFIVSLFLRYLPQRRLQARAQQTGLARAFPLFNLEYWSRSDRVAFFLICIASWLALGVAGAMTETLVRQASIPLSVGMGNFGGPATTWYFENRLADRPESELLLAIAYQDEGRNDKAEQLYRKLNRFPESWNNLGVLLQDSGKTAEAQQAYEEAVRLDPSMPDARWNLEHKPNDFWTGMHQKYVPDRGMIAPPSREHFMTAFGLGSPVQFGLQALAGAFTGYAMLRANARFVIPRPFDAGFILTLAEIAIGFLLLFVLPYRDVTQPAYRSQTVIEYLLPGIAPQWGQRGGIVLVAWAAFLVQWIASLAGLGTAAFGGFPNIQRAFGVPSTAPPSNVFQLNAPYMLGGIVLLYAINAILLARARRHV